MDKEQNILRYILKADLIPKDYNDLKEEHIKMINRLIVALDERDEYHGKLLYTKKIEKEKIMKSIKYGQNYRLMDEGKIPYVSEEQFIQEL